MTDTLAPVTAAELLSSRRRHLLLRSLEDADGAVSVADVAESIASVENGPDYGHQDRKRAYISIHQSHADALEDAQVVIYDDRGDLHCGEHFDAAIAALDALEGVCAGDVSRKRDGNGIIRRLSDAIADGGAWA